MAGGMLNMVITAVDKATPNIGKVGKSLGKLGKVAGGIGGGLKNVALGAAGIAAGVGTFAIAATKAAADEEKAIATLNAVLKQRGMLTDENLAKMADQEAALANLAISDDEYRASLGKATAFTKNFNDALAIQSAAAELAAGAGISLEEATVAIGKAYSGKGGKALSKYGVSLDKVVKRQKIQVKGLDAVNRVLAKYNGAAEAAANTTSGKFARAQIAANNLIEDFGSRFLPIAADAADFLAKNVLPAVSKALDALGPVVDTVAKNLGDAFGPIIQDNITNLTKPGGVFDSVGKVVGPIFEMLAEKVGAFIGAMTGPDGLLTAIGDVVGALWGDGKGPLAFAVNAIGALLGGLFDIITGIVGVLAAVVRGITDFLTASTAADAYQASLGANAPTVGGKPGDFFANSAAAMGSGYGAGGFIIPPMGSATPSYSGGNVGTSYGANGIQIVLSSDIPLVVDKVNDALGSSYTVITNTRGR